jgi:ABC-type lipoprotein export system ATPase subunit
MISTKELRFAYKNMPFLFPDIHCNSGDTLLITGASGKGKSTFLHLLSGLLKPHSGAVYIDNTDITLLNTQQSDRFRRKNIGIVFQQSHYIASLSLWDNLVLCSQWPDKMITAERVEMVLSQLRLINQASQKPGTLSVGQQQRLSIARAVLNMPSVLLADEPTSGLDDANCYRVAETLISLSKDNNTSLLMVTHDQRLKDIFQSRIELL